MSDSRSRELVFAVPAQAAGKRLDVWLASQPDAPSRSQIKLASDEGGLSCGGKVVRSSLRLRGGEHVTLRINEEPDCDASPAPEAIPLHVLYEDDQMVAIDKPAGMVVHPAAGNRAGTLVNALLHRYAAGAASLPQRAGIVHRLDRDTSGVILVARTVAAHEALARQFRERTVRKEYLAIVHGVVRTRGTIDLPIGRHPTDRKRMSTSARRSRSAITDYEPLETFDRRGASLLLVRPHTGRTHQIRVHLAARGWPIIGDKTYGRRGTGSPEHPRQALHAAAIEFELPDRRTRLRVESPLPADLQALLRTLRPGGERPGNPG